MLSKSKIKYIRSLDLKKNRNEYQTFIAEGNKLVADILPFFECELLVAKSSWLATQGDISAGELICANDNIIDKISFLKSPQDVFAVFKQPIADLSTIDTQTQLIIALDGIQDPGNLGTIIRLADWFGIEHIVCSLDTVDVFSPKVIQATMGAIARVKVHYTDLPAFLSQQNSPIYGTFLDGENMYTKELSNHGVIVMGNEGQGIRSATEASVSERLYIPNFPAIRETSESLNVAIATSIVCAEFRRREVASVQTK
jgi:TrmH family RNA methyltransferase